MKITKCTIDMQNCDIYDHLNVNNFCERISQKNALWSPLASNIVPPVSCPLKIVCLLNFLFLKLKYLI